MQIVCVWISYLCCVCALSVLQAVWQSGTCCEHETWRSLICAGTVLVMTAWSHCAGRWAITTHPCAGCLSLGIASGSVAISLHRILRSVDILLYAVMSVLVRSAKCCWQTRSLPIWTCLTTASARRVPQSSRKASREIRAFSRFRYDIYRHIHRCAKSMVAGIDSVDIFVFILPRWLPPCSLLLLRPPFTVSLQMNFNPIGSDGARALMRSMRTESSAHRSIGLDGCSMQASVVFDPNQAAGKYSLDLSVPYERVRLFCGLSKTF